MTTSATRTAIVGSRAHQCLPDVWRVVHALPRETTVVSGGAIGVDSVAEWSARQRGIAVEVHLPDYATHGLRAPLVRNGTIVETADDVHAFPWGAPPWLQARGTMDAVGKAEKAGRSVELHAPGQPSLLVFSCHLSATKAPGYLDITRGSAHGNRAFAPSHDILRPAIAARREAAEIRKRIRCPSPAKDQWDGMTQQERDADVELLRQANAIERAAWDAYLPAFQSEMRESWGRNRAEWERVLALPVVSLACYCSDEYRSVGECHTRLVAGYLVRAGASSGRTVVDGGDLPRVTAAAAAAESKQMELCPTAEPTTINLTEARDRRPRPESDPRIARAEEDLAIAHAERDLARAERDLYLFYLRRPDDSDTEIKAAQARVNERREHLEKLLPPPLERRVGVRVPHATSSAEPANSSK
jgi:hypothetical protein